VPFSCISVADFKRQFQSQVNYRMVWRLTAHDRNATCRMTANWLSLFSGATKMKDVTDFNWLTCSSRRCSTAPKFRCFSTTSADTR